jgi:pimeloyl-ACP methyl ester carboxylesterase
VGIGREVHSFNFSGHGSNTGKSSFGIETFATDLHEYLQQHQLQRVNIFGYSMGGYVALWYAMQFPGQVQSIVTLGTKFDWNVESAQQEVKKLNADKILEKIPAFARLLNTRHADWRLLLEQTAKMMLTLGESPLLHEGNLATLQVPVLIGLGELDDMADRAFSETVANILPRGKFQLLNGTPHPIEKVKVALLTRLCFDFFANPEKA